MRSPSLEAFLKTPFKPIYLISSDEPLLRDEALHAFKKLATLEGYETTHNITVEAQFQWEAFFASLNQGDLFSEKQLSIVHLPRPELPVAATNALSTYLENAPTSQVVVLFCSKLSSTALKSAWLTLLDRYGTIVQLAAPDKTQLASWIAARARVCGLTLNEEAVDLAVQYTQGNLTASHQVIERLSLAYGNTLETIDAEQMRSVLSDSTCFSTYDLLDAWLAGDLVSALKILRRLQEEGIEPILILWILISECRTLVRIAADLSAGHSLIQAFNTHRVWAKRQPLIKAQLKKQQHHSMLLRDHLLPLELVIKGAAPGNVWEGLERFLLFSMRGQR